VTVFQKAVFSLLIAILLFAVFTVFAFTGLFDLVEARFYNPAVVRAIGREIDADARVIEEFFEELWIRFAATLKEGAVRRSLLSGLDSEDIALRARLYGELLESLGGLQSVRFIDSGGLRIHFSTWPPDILRQDENSIAYRNYGAAENSAAYIPYGQVAATVPALILDGAGERIVFSLPFYDSFDVYRGTALFSLSVRAVMDRMVSAGRIKVGEDVSVVSEPPGLVTGLPAVGRDVLLPLIARMWSENSLSLGALNSDLTGINLALISRRMDQSLFAGRLVNESLLTFPLAMRIILLITFFITVYLIIFLLFNLRQDDLTIIQSRLQKLQAGLLEEYYGHTEDLNWSRWKRELEHRREEVHSEVKRGLKAKADRLAEIDKFIDRSWDDLVAIIGGHIERRSGIDEDTLNAFLGPLLPEMPDAAVINKAGPEGPEEPDAERPAETFRVPTGGKPESEFNELEFAELDELEELEAAELELIEPEAADKPEKPADPAGEEAELEELEAVAEPGLAGQDGEPIGEKPEDPAGTAAELEELEAAEPGFAGQDGGPGTMFHGIDPLEFEDSDGHETAIDKLARAIEFGPESQELEQERERAAKSMAEQFEIQSPFASIFSNLSDLECEQEPVENLEALEQEPDNAAEAELEELRFNGGGPQLSILFQKALHSEIAVLAAEDEDEPGEAEELETEPTEAGADGVITERDGVIYIKESVLNPGQETIKGLDKNFKNLIDSILNNT
jgi:hypothetical protein